MKESLAFLFFVSNNFQHYCYLLGNVAHRLKIPVFLCDCFEKGKAERRAEPERIGDKCKSTDIVVNQAATEPMPNGIPGYTVEITNMCMSGCIISRIHISCGWFSSAKLINPRIFKRIHYDDCLVNNGKPLPYGSTLSFHYANTFPYPLSVAFVTCS